MVVYKFFLNLKNSPERYDYPLDLTADQENDPEAIFTKEIRQAIRKHFQARSSCSINDHRLNQIIAAWVEDIREGYRETVLTLDLPLLSESNLENIQDEGNQELPPLFTPDLGAIEPMEGMFPPLEDIFNT
jgi:hypothetical protein